MLAVELFGLALSGVVLVRRAGPERPVAAINECLGPVVAGSGLRAWREGQGAFSGLRSGRRLLVLIALVGRGLVAARGLALVAAGIARLARLVRPRRIGGLPDDLSAELAADGEHSPGALVGVAENDPEFRIGVKDGHFQLMRRGGLVFHLNEAVFHVGWHAEFEVKFQENKSLLVLPLPCRGSILIHHISGNGLPR